MVALATKKKSDTVESVTVEVGEGEAVLVLDDARYSLTPDQVNELRRQAETAHFGLL